LLTVAALASLAVAGLRMAHAARSSPPAPQYPVYGSSPSAEAAIFRSLHVPPGFRRFHPCVLGECFILRKSLPLEVAMVRHIAEEDPLLADHFAARLRTGAMCMYKPDPTARVSWTVEETR